MGGNLKMKVKLISMTENPIDIMWTAARTCYSEKGPIDIWYKYDENEKHKDFIERYKKRWKLVKQVLSSGHESIAEYCNFVFAIEDVDRACYDDETEVLTKNGWKLFKDIVKEDEFATINNDGEVEFQESIDSVCYKYTGKLHRYKSQNLDLCVTPNHNLYIKKYDVRKEDVFHLVPSESINSFKRFYMSKEFNYKEVVSDTIKVEGYNYPCKNNQGSTYLKYANDIELKKEVFFPFLAWYLSDGSVYYNEKENSYCVSISQTKCEANIKNKTRERIINLIESMGIHTFTDDHNVKFKNLTLGKFLQGLGHCDEKYIPWNIYREFNQPLAKLFIDEYFKGDGHVDKNGCGKLYTSSKKLAEQLYQLCFIAGYSCIMRIVQPRGEHFIGNQVIRGKKPSFVINVTLTRNGRNKRIVINKDRHYSEKDYDGIVYCVTVPNHTLFVRRNGIAVWCGNCTHQLTRHRHAVFSQQSQRYVEIKESYDTLSELFENPKTDKDEDYLYSVANKYFTEVTKDNYRMYIQSLLSYLQGIKLGMKPEEARTFLPNATKTNIVMGVNLRELMHMCNLRLCTRAQAPIRYLFKLIKEEVTRKDKFIGELLVPNCELLGYCKEAKSCGRKPKLEDLNAK